MGSITEKGELSVKHDLAAFTGLVSAICIAVICTGAKMVELTFVVVTFYTGRKVFTR